MRYFFIYLLFLISSCGSLTPSVKKMYKKSLTKHNHFDVVIIPGVPFYEPKWDMVMLMRITWALHLYKQGIVDNFIMSGSSVYSPYVEGEIMKQYALKLGIPEKNIFVESKAEHSTENAWYGFYLAKKLGYKKIAFASDPFQTKMIYRFCRRRIKDLHFLPIMFDTLKNLPHITPEINYDSLKLQNFTPLPERESFFKRLRGTRGKHIDFTKKEY